ncbi:protein DpdF [Candidatus Poriferisodalis sp.]|uniref:protein DpdF n=1 Tax=Candidatus Poriferisodalis sp. TaxID=3101277 RepID=UPI003B0152F1
MRSVQEVQSLLNALGAEQDIAASDRMSAALNSAIRRRGGSADAAVLLRQVLRCDDVRRGESAFGGDDKDESLVVSARLDVPHSAAFSSDFPWGDFGLVSEPRSLTMTRIRAVPWKPRWLDCESVPAVDHDVSNLRVVRRDESVHGDPFLLRIDENFSRYRTPGQRAAVRSALLAPPGSTLVVNLPTGGGKTLAMLAPAINASTDNSVSVIVVPTVALALDQERRYRKQHLGAPPTAYHSGLTPDQKRDLLNRLRSGSQPILFTNPEALVTSLARPLTSAAEGGRLRLIAIDEAHVVASWGDAFRPHFHALAGLRTHLLREADAAGYEAFRTVLASATITEDTLRLLEALFGRPGPFLHVGAPVVRPEPSYWAASASDPDERDARLIEALRHLPRPAIVYTTLRDERVARPGTLTPNRLRRLTSSYGFRRFAVVDGESTTAERESVLRDLRESPKRPALIDLVFATSAFGLGIDVPDIRTVVHACIPENLDRYYQEVGRGGRDGRPMISLVLPTKEDEVVAKSIATPRFLTVERAQDRWTAMAQAAEALGPDLLRVPLAAVPSNLDQHSEYNERWNLLTVSLMARASALSWDFSLSEFQTDAGPVTDDSGWLTVRVLRGDHQDPRFWRDIVENVRATMVNSAPDGLNILTNALSGRQCAGKLVGQNYSISSPPEFRTTCMPSCGGCTYCRRNGRTRWSSPSASPSGIEVVPAPAATRLSELAAMGRWGPRVIIVTDQGILRSRRKIRHAIQSLIAAGRIQLIVMPREAHKIVVDWLPQWVHDRPPLMVSPLDDFDPLTEVGVPTLVIVGEADDPTPYIEGSSRSSLVVVLGPGDLRVGASGLSLADSDSAFRLGDLEHIL